MGTSLLFLTSGLFLGWSLGANDASNVFGTAVGTRMIRFATAAWISSVFIVLGAVFGGGGGSTMFGSRGAGNFLTRLTTGAAVVFMVTSLTLAYFGQESAKSSLFTEDGPALEAAPEEEDSPFAEPQTGGFEEVQPEGDAGGFEEVQPEAQETP